MDRYIISEEVYSRLSWRLSPRCTAASQLYLCVISSVLLLACTDKLGHIGLVFGSALKNWIFVQKDLFFDSGDLFLEFQVLEHTLVKKSFRASAMTQPVIFLFQTVIMQFELIKTVFIYIFQHRDGTARDPAALFQTLHSSTIIFILTHHKIIIKRLAFCADKIRSGKKRCRSSAHFIHVWNIQRQWVFVLVFPLVSSYRDIAQHHDDEEERANWRVVVGAGMYAGWGRSVNVGTDWTSALVHWCTTQHRTQFNLKTGVLARLNRFDIRCPLLQ